MNQIETWFGVLTRQAIRRGSFDGVRAQIETIDAFTSLWNDDAEPFARVKTADETLATATRRANDHSGARHEQRSRSAALGAVQHRSGTPWNTTRLRAQAAPSEALRMGRFHVALGEGPAYPPGADARGGGKDEIR